ncbi:MAG: hypothetical protein R6X15_07640 [Pseudomonadota bacterium]
MHRGMIAALLCCGLSMAAPVAAETFGNNLNVFLGSKALDEDDWLADEQGEFGLLYDFGAKGWPVQLAVGLLFSRGDFDGLVYVPGSGYGSYDQEVSTREFNLGVRKYWVTYGNMYPYLGGGLAHIRLKAEERYDGGPLYSDSGSGTGLWIDGGLMWRFNQFNIGFNVRASAAEVALGDNDYEAGGGHAGLLLGYHW